MSSTSAQGIIACSVVLPVLSIVVVSLRFYVRSTQNARLRFDDWAQLPALILFIAMAIAALIGVANGALGYPSPPTDPPDSSPSVILCEKLWFAIQIIQIPALALIKIAAFRFYRRIFCVTHTTPLYIIIWIFIGLVIAWAIAFLVFYITSCGSHPEAAWSGLTGFLQYCLDSEKFEKSYAITDFILDTFVLVTPIPSIWSLQTSMSRKLGITGVFMLALVGYGASIARLVIFVQLTQSTLGTSPPDIQTQDTQATWFSMLEVGLALIALNMPSLWSLFTGASMASIVRSVRSVLSLRSLGSRGGSGGSGGSRRSRHDDSRRYAQFDKSSKKELQSRASDAESQQVELVPQVNHARAESSATCSTSEHRQKELDLERGIKVEKTLEQTETRV